MPYLDNQQLPKGVQDNLPKHGQDIYREAFNKAWEQYKSPNKRRAADSREVVAHKIAWAAVEKKYYKDEHGKWALKV